MSVEDSWHSIDRATGEKIRTQRYGRGKRWRVRNRGAQTVSFEKRSDAVAHDTQVKGELFKGVTPFDHRAGMIKFTEYAAKWLREHHYDANSRATVRSRIDTHLTPTFGELQMRDIHPSTVTAWLAEMRDKHSRAGTPLAARTIEAVYTALVSIMRSAVIDKVIPVNPCDEVTRPQPGGKAVLAVWEQDRVNKLLAAIPDRWHVVPLLASTCGLRQGEALALAMGDIGWFRNELTVRHQVKRVGGKLVHTPPKRGKVRTVPLPKITSDALAAHIERYGTVTARCQCCGTDNTVLVSDRGHLASQQVWGAVWRDVLTTVGITPSRTTGLHQMRHAYASLLIDGGASMKQVQTYMGHESIKTTADIYGHLFERSNDRARSVIDAAFTDAARPLPSIGSR